MTLAHLPPETRPAKLESRIPKILRTGLLVALLIIAAGLALTLALTPSYDHSMSLKDLALGLTTLSPAALLGLGLLALILTPVARVCASLLHFASVKDRLYVLLTAIVLVNLALAFLLGAV